MTRGINRPEGTSRVPIVTDISVVSPDDGGGHSDTTQIDAGNYDDVEITRVLNTVQDAGLFP